MVCRGRPGLSFGGGHMSVAHTARLQDVFKVRAYMGWLVLWHVELRGWQPPALGEMGEEGDPLLRSPEARCLHPGA